MGKGVLVLFLSKYRKEKEKIEIQKYHLEGSGTPAVIFEGKQTNEAPVKYLLTKAVQNGSPIRKVVCIITREVRAEGSFGLFQDMVNNYVKNDAFLSPFYEKTLINYCGVDYDASVEESTSRAMQVYREIARFLISEGPEEAQENEEIYIDYTGGLRDISFLMTVIVRYLEYQNIICKEIVYVNDEKKIIHSINCIYDMFQLLNGVDQFVRTGNAERLGKCYEKEQDEETKKLLEQIQEFSQVMSLCNIKKIDEILPKISRSLQSYKKNQRTESFFVEMLGDFTDIIRKKLYIEGEKTLTYPQLIHWCLDNNMVQQALTLYTEKMPQYYYQRGFLKMPERIENIPTGYTKETAAFYIKLFDDIKGKNEQTRVKTYEKKIMAPDKLKGFQGEIPESNLDNKKLYEIMKYFCALKLIRNRVNHASEAGFSDDEENAIARLEKNHRICMDFGLDNVKDLIARGLEACC